MVPTETMKEYVDEETLKKERAVARMMGLLQDRYRASFQQIGGGWMVITRDGGDGGDIKSNGDYIYDRGKKVNFLHQSHEEIMDILDEYFEV